MQWSPRRSSVAAWVTYDLANTIFALGVSGLYFAAWIVDEQGRTDEELSYAIAAAMLVVVFVSPWIGARTDRARSRLPYLAGATLVAVGATSLLGAVGAVPSLALYALALIGFNLGTVVYDSLLPEVSTEQNRGRISGLGVGFGYVGSFIAVGIGRVVLDQMDLGYPVLFRAIAASFAIFALPAFFLVRERPRPVLPGPSWREALRQLAISWRHAGELPGVRRFLIGRFLYSDAINTLIGGFLTIFAIEEIGFSRSEVEVLLAAAIAGSIAGGFGGGMLVDRLGPRPVLHGVLYLWIGAIAVGMTAAAADLRQLGWLLGPIGGFALGGTWASDRVYMVRLSPPDRIGEFYGLYGIVGRFATVLGPLLWGFVVDRLGLGRTAAMGALALYVVAARLVLERIPSPAGHPSPAGGP